jgi:hypothetical protein
LSSAVPTPLKVDYTFKLRDSEKDVGADCIRAQTQVKPGQQLNVTFTDLPSAVVPPFNVSQT